ARASRQHLGFVLRGGAHDVRAPAVAQEARGRAAAIHRRKEEMKTSASIVLGVIVLSITACTSMPMSGSASAPDIVMEEFMIPSGDPGIELYVRNKHP